MRKHREVEDSISQRRYKNVGVVTPKVISVRTLQNESAFETVGFAKMANGIISGEIILLNILPEFLDGSQGKSTYNL